jgi:hypothetical protein
MIVTLKVGNGQRAPLRVEWLARPPANESTFQANVIDARLDFGGQGEPFDGIEAAVLA